MSFHVRVSRFVYIILGYFAGFLGIAFGIVLHVAILCNINSYGVSYLSPYTPASHTDNLGYFLSPAWKREKRRSFLNSKRQNKQEETSEIWRIQKGVK